MEAFFLNYYTVIFQYVQILHTHIYIYIYKYAENILDMSLHNIQKSYVTFEHATLQFSS